MHECRTKCETEKKHYSIPNIPYGKPKSEHNLQLRKHTLHDVDQPSPLLTFVLTEKRLALVYGLECESAAVFNFVVLGLESAWVR